MAKFTRNFLKQMAYQTKSREVMHKLARRPDLGTIDKDEQPLGQWLGDNKNIDRETLLALSIHPDVLVSYLAKYRLDRGQYADAPSARKRKQESIVSLLIHRVLCG